jgi:hypothetical protein
MRKFVFRLTTSLCLPGLLGCSKSITPWMKAWPIAYYPTEWRAPVKEAHVVTNDNHIYEGYIKLLQSRPYFALIPYKEKWLQASIENIEVREISTMRLYNDSTDHLQNYSDCLWIDAGHFGEILGKKNNIKICKTFMHRGGWSNRTILFTSKDTIRIFSWGAYMTHFGHVKPLILKFIHKRYGIRPDPRGLGTERAMIEYILAREMMAAPGITLTN